MQLVWATLLLWAPLLTLCTDLGFPPDCSDIQQKDKTLKTGVYTIYPLGEKTAVQVYCDMDTEGGGWTVIQKRIDGSVNFFRNWETYKLGFGNAAGEYWLGLDNMHYLTTKLKYELFIVMEDFEGNKATARYSTFVVDAECDGYKLHVDGFTDGAAVGNALAYHNGYKFTTFDKDNDGAGINCAKKHLGGFWYRYCHQTNPNGLYQWGADDTMSAVGVEWSSWKGHNYSLKTYVMMIRPLK